MFQAILDDTFRDGASMEEEDQMTVEKCEWLWLWLVFDGRLLTDLSSLSSPRCLSKAVGQRSETAGSCYFCFYARRVVDHHVDFFFSPFYSTPLHSTSPSPSLNLHSSNAPFL